MDFTQIVIGMLGQQFADAINLNFGNTKTAVEALQAALLLKVAGNNVKQIKVQDGLFYYTLDGSNWVPVNTVSWGSILGNITNQTDLKNALDAKANQTDLNTTNSSVSGLSNDVSGLQTTVSSMSSTVASHTTSIGTLQTEMLEKVSSATIKSFRIGASDVLEYSLDGINWSPVLSSNVTNFRSIQGQPTDNDNLANALNSKASAVALQNHIANTQNPHGVTKQQVGLGNVDNTSDANKPLSTAQQAALDALSAQLTSLDTNKVSNLGSVTGIRKVTLSEYNELNEANEIIPTVLYIVID